MVFFLRAHWLTDTFESVAVAAGIALVLWWLFTPAPLRVTRALLRAMPSSAAGQLGR